MVQLLLLSCMIIGLLTIVIFPFTILLGIFLKIMEQRSKGLVTMLLGFLLISFGFLFVVILGIAWPERFLITTEIGYSYLGIKLHLMDIILWSIPLIWIVFSCWIMWKGYTEYKLSGGT